jgi:hypothetical protein
VDPIGDQDAVDREASGSPGMRARTRSCAQPPSAAAIAQPSAVFFMAA